MRKQSATITPKKNRIVEKSVMMNKSIQLKLDFDLQVTAWVPVAKENKPMPQVNLTMNVSYDDVRFGTDKVEDLVNALVDIIDFLEKNKDVLNSTVEEERIKWHKLCEEKFKRASGMKVVEMKKVG